MILTLSTRTLQQRLIQLQETEEFQRFRHCKRFLRIVVSMKSATQRLQTLRASPVSDITLDQLIGSDSYFEQSTNRKRSDKEELTKQKRKLKAFVSESFFREHGITEEQLECGLPIIIYDHCVVRNTWNQFVDTEWKESPFCLQFVIYSMNRDLGSLEMESFSAKVLLKSRRSETGPQLTESVDNRAFETCQSNR